MSQFYSDSRTNDNIEQFGSKGQVYEEQEQRAKQIVDTLRVEFLTEAADTITEAEIVSFVQTWFTEE